MRLPDIDSLVARAPVSTVLCDRRGEPIRYRLARDNSSARPARDNSSARPARDNSSARPARDGTLAARVPLARIDPDLVRATIAAEDRRFREHRGVDLLAVARAAASNATSGRIVSGASTITMQTARLLRPLPRGYYNKLREMVLALALERRFDKDEILELHLNLSPYGGNVRGVEMAARRFFGRGSGELSIAEAALLAGLPQSPSRLRPDRRPEAARRRRDWIIERLHALGMIGAAERDEALATPVRAGWHPLPFGAPHLSDLALRRCAPGETARLSLDPAIQRLAADLLGERLRVLEPAGVSQGAVVVAETRSGRIRALVGSRDFRDPRDGQVNGATAPRSPGSLLKPFIYGMAFERGIALPDTLVEDRLRRYRDGYAPHNFAGRFEGAVSARDALVRSLNTPAVDLLERVGVGDVIARLRALGLASIRRGAGHHGLALGLGGAEATLLELVEAYACLGRLGEHRPLSWREDRSPPATVRRLDRDAALALADVLRAVPPTSGEREAGLDLPEIAAKTGTSFGLRDAWAIGYTPRWTVGVWIGNFDGSPAPALVGAEAAMPLLVAITRRLETLRGGAWYPAPDATPGARRAPGLLAASGEAARTGISWSLPGDGQTYRAHGRRGGDRLVLSAAAEPSSRLRWFIDDAYLGETLSGEVLEATLRLPGGTSVAAGTHRVTVVAEDGSRLTRSVRLEGESVER